MLLSFQCTAYLQPQMFKTSHPALPTRYLAPVTLAILSACIAVISSTAHAQVYRIVGPDGRVTFSDRPASSSAATSPASATTGASTSSNSATASLPYELRQVATRYPVTLYSTKACEACDEARSFLRDRGIPFSERTVETSSDAAALKKLSGQEGLPFATIGGQHLKGYGSEQWTQLLNAAGYPAQSQLPQNYQTPAATPLTAPAPIATEKKAAEARSAPRAAESTAPAPGARTPNNPAGLRF